MNRIKKSVHFLIKYLVISKKSSTFAHDFGDLVSKLSKPIQ